MQNIQNFGKSIIAGRLPDEIKTVPRETGEIRRLDDGTRVRCKTEPVPVAYFKIGPTTYSCLNNPEAIKALGLRLSKAKNLTTEKPKTDKLPTKQQVFSWSVACSLLTSESEESPTECLENYTNYLNLYGLTPSRAQTRNPNDILILVKIKPYTHNIAWLPDLIESLVYSACDGKPFAKDPMGMQVTHHGTGMLVTYEKAFNERTNKLSPDHISRIVSRLQQQTVINPSVDTTTPGKFTHLYYYPEQLKTRIVAK
jgi:hypothetical protein